MDMPLSLPILGFFLAAALIHLASLFFQKRLITAISKLCLVPPLLVLYLITVPHRHPAVILGALLGWIGDALLLKSSSDDKRHIFFKLGLVSFLLGHLAYIQTLLPRAPSHALALNFPVLAVSLAAAVVLGIAVLRIIRPSRDLLGPTICYSIVLELMSLSALQFALYLGTFPGWIIFAGSLCFLASDTLLAAFTFRARPKGGHFLVMFFYIAAQLGIIGGFTLIG